MASNLVDLNRLQNALTAYRNITIPYVAELTMSGASVTLNDPVITADTHCQIIGNPKQIVTWTTANGSLTITARKAPASSVTFKVVLTRTVEIGGS